MNRWMPHPSTEEPDAYTLKMEQIHNQGCDPVTGANNLTWEDMDSMAPLPSSGLTGTPSTTRCRPTRCPPTDRPPEHTPGAVVAVVHERRALP